MGSFFVVFFLCLLLLAEIRFSSANVVLEISELLKSKPKSYYQSEQAFIQTVNEFSSKYQRAGDTQHTQAIPWIIKFSETCNHLCHHNARDAFGEYRYEWFHKSIVIITAKANEVESFRSTNPNTIIEYIALHPDMKINQELRKFDKTAPSCDSYRTTKSPTEVMMVRFTLHHMPVDEYHTFLEFAKKLEGRYNSKVSISFTYPNVPTLLYGTAHITDCALTMEIVKILSHRREIIWLERQYPMILYNRWAKGVCDTGDIAFTPLNDNNITGMGEIVGIADSGIDMSNCYFYDPHVKTPFQADSDPISKVNKKHRKVVLYMYQGGKTDTIDSTEGHGTHVSGTIAGLAYKNYGDYTKFNGMSSDTKIAFYDLQKGESSSLITPSYLNVDLFQKLYATGAKIFSNSWGSSSDTATGAYTSDAYQVDMFLWSYPDAMVFFAAGNTGASTNTNGGTLNTINSPGTCKNCVTVGASSSDHQAWEGLSGSSSVDAQLNQDGVAYFSSCGPTDDKRLKPDILAPGFFLFSAKGYANTSSYHCDIQGMSGTSMATPVTAGHAIKVRQYFVQGYYPSGERVSAHGFTPSGALIKAILIHSGRPMSTIVKANNAGSFLSAKSITAYPSVVQGYGRIQLNTVLQFNSPSSRTPISMFVIGDTNSRSTAAASRYAEMKVTGEVHKYNFTTSTVSTQHAIRITFVYTDYPGTVSSTTNANLVNDLKVSVVDTAGNSVAAYLVSDTVKSNVQMIDIPVPTANTRYFVSITAVTISHSPQPYALVITGAITYLNTNTSSSSSTSSSMTYTTSTDTISQYTTVWIVVFAILCAFLFVMLVVLYYYNRKMDFLENGDLDAEQQKKPIKSSVTKKQKK